MYDKIKTYIKDNLGDLAFGIICVAIIILFMYGTGKLLQNNGGGTNAVRNELSNAQSQQAELTDSVKSARETASETRGTTQNIRSTVEATGEPIEDSQRILSQIRARGKS